MKALWIAGWYPDKIEPYSGDFVQRHAQAVSLFHDVTVIFARRDAEAMVTQDERTEENSDGNLKEKRIYYHIKPGLLPVWDKIISFRKYQSVLKREIEQYIKKNGKPDIIHFHIGMRTGVLTEWVKRLGIPYVVSEHWTGFLDEAKPNFHELPGLLKRNWKALIGNAAGVHVVSAYSEAAITRLVRHSISFVIIPNVVNTTIFFPEPKEVSDILRLVFVTSGLELQKNIKDTLLALSLLKQEQVPFRMDIFGPVPAEYHQLALSSGISKEVIFHGEKGQEELAFYFRKADGLIIYSRFENSPCVIIESFVSGTPVIASDITPLHETIEEGRNGLFVKGEDPSALAGSLLWLAGNKSIFDRNTIAQNAASAYNYETVGKMFSAWYKDLLGRRNK